MAMVIFAASPWRAALAQSRDEIDLCKLANLIVIGTVQRKECFEDLDEAEESMTIWTRHTIGVERVVAGSADRTLLYVSPGGEVGDRGVIVSGSPVLLEGRKYLLFLVDYQSMFGQSLYRFGAGYVDHLYVPIDLPLPDETTMRNLWQNLCATHPSGITPRDIRGKGTTLLPPLPAEQTVPAGARSPDRPAGSQTTPENQ